MLKQAKKVNEVVVALSAIPIGAAFRFAHDRFEEAMSEGRIFMRINPNGGEKDRILCVSLDGKEQRLFDGIHRVVQHEHDTVVFW